MAGAVWSHQKSTLSEATDERAVKAGSMNAPNSLTYSLSSSLSSLYVLFIGEHAACSLVSEQSDNE